MKRHIVKAIASVAFGALFLVVASYVIGIAAALAVPSWSRPLAYAHPKLFLLIVELFYTSLPLATLAIIFGAVLGRVVQTRTLKFGFLCASPWLVQVAWSAFANFPMLSGAQWLAILQNSAAVVAGLMFGMLVFGHRSDPDNFNAVRA